MSMKFADLVSAQSPRAAALPPSDGSRRATRAAKPTSTGGARLSGGSGTSKVGRPGNTSRAREERELDEMAAGSRFGHWATVGQAAEPSAKSTSTPSLSSIPAAHGMRAAAARKALHSDPVREAAGKKVSDQTIATAKRLGIIK